MTEGQVARGPRAHPEVPGFAHRSDLDLTDAMAATLAAQETASSNEATLTSTIPPPGSSGQERCMARNLMGASVISRRA